MPVGRQAAFGNIRLFPGVVHLRVSSESKWHRGTKAILLIPRADPWEDKALLMLWVCGLAATAVAFVVAWP